MWKCCKRNYADGIKKCRVCGGDKPVYGIKMTPAQDPDTKRKELLKKKKRTKEPLTGTAEQLYVSTLKMKDGRTVEDLKRDGYYDNN